jgi:hypothetical protein
MLYMGAGSDGCSIRAAGGWESKGIARRRGGVQRDSARAGRLYR